MCTDVEIHADGKLTFCETKGELEAVLGGPPVSDCGDMQWDADTCLCPMDIEATAEKYGYRWRVDDGVVVFERAAHNTGGNEG